MEEKDKNKNEMRQFIENWKLSKKYAQLKKALEQKAKELFDVSKLSQEKIVEYITKNQLTREEIETACHSILEFNSLTEEEKNEIVWIVDELNSHQDKENIIRKLIQQLLTWYTYIYLYQLKEDYELCGKMYRVIQFEKADCLSLLEGSPMSEQDDADLIEELDGIIKKKILQL